MLSRSKSTRALVSAILTTLFVAAPGPARATMPLPVGGLPDAVLRARDQGLFDLPPAPGTPGTSAVLPGQGEWQLPVILVAYSDESLQFGAAHFDSALFDTSGSTPTGSVYDYYRWASGQRLRVRGRVVATVTLPHDRHYYGYGGYGLSFTSSPNNMYGLIVDALSICQQSVDWSLFDRDHDGYVDMLWVVHAGQGAETSLDRDDMWSVTSRLSGGWRNGVPYLTSQLVPGTVGLYYRVDRFSMLPELSGFHPGSPAEIGVYCHEFGHALGLPDLYDTSALGGTANAGPGNWALMSTGGYGADGHSPEYPAHVGGWSSVFLGWRQPLRPTRDTTLTLAPLGDGGDVLEFWFQGEPSPEHFLLEARARRDFDRTIQYEGLIVTHLDETTIGQGIGNNKVNAGPSPGLWIVEADGDSDLVVGRNRGDAYDPFPGLGGRFALGDASPGPSTSTFDGAPTNISLENIVWMPEGSHLTVRVRAPGWRDPLDGTPPGYSPIEHATGGHEAVRDALGGIYVVKSEIVAGKPAIVMRERHGGPWLSPLTLSSPGATALDPAVAVSRSGDLAVAWADARTGRSHLHYRARVRGVWSEEATLESLPGDNLTPSVGFDDLGRVLIAWLNVSNDTPTVYFGRFLYFAPFLQPIRASAPGTLPGSPALALAPRAGRGFVMWEDRAASPQRLYFSRFSPDSGLSAPLPLTPASPYAQSAFDAAIDTSGTLHVVWSTAGSTQRDLHYQRRFPGTRPYPADTVVGALSGPAQSVSVAVDPSLTVHVAYEVTASQRPQVLYKRGRPGAGWDELGTEVSAAGSEYATRPWVLAESPGNVLVLYTLDASDGKHFLERERQLDPRPITGVAGDVEPAAPGTLAAAPNPLRPGLALTFRWSGGASDAIELFDLAGRRVAVVPLAGSGSLRTGRLDPDRCASLPAGVLFARARGSGATSRVVVLR